MQVHILGAHQGESRDVRFISLLIDRHLAIDAGGLTTSLSLAEQAAIDAVLITHRHYDHIKDLPMLAHNLWESRGLDVYCTDDTRDALQKHLFNGVIWPDVTNPGDGYYPITYHTVVPGERFDLLGYSITPVPMVHSVPTVGYCVERDGRRVFYTADTGGEPGVPWAALRPDLLIIETTLRSSEDTAAARFKHLTPLSLGRELRDFHASEGYYPRTVCVHLNPGHERAIREELIVLARELGADITAAHEGMVVEV